MEPYKLNTNWCLWYHSINDTNWKNNSYKNIYDIKNVLDIKFLNDTIHKIHLQNSMFFLMREGIFPNWEDPDNRSGGCLSFKVTSIKVMDEWIELLLRCITDNILNEKNEEINGISISPKKEFNIIKIWLRNHGFDYKKHLTIEEPSLINIENSLYKKHEF